MTSSCSCGVKLEMLDLPETDSSLGMMQVGFRAKHPFWYGWWLAKAESCPQPPVFQAAWRAASWSKTAGCLSQNLGVPVGAWPASAW